MLSLHPAITLFPYTRTSSAGRWRTWAGSAKHPAPCWQGRAPAPCQLPDFPTSRKADKLASRQTPPPPSSSPLHPVRARRILFSYPRVNLTRPRRPTLYPPHPADSPTSRQVGKLASWQVGKLASWQAPAVQRGGAPARNVHPPTPPLRARRLISPTTREHSPVPVARLNPPLPAAPAGERPQPRLHHLPPGKPPPPLAFLLFLLPARGRPLALAVLPHR